MDDMPLATGPGRAMTAEVHSMRNRAAANSQAVGRGVDETCLSDRGAREVSPAASLDRGARAIAERALGEWRRLEQTIAPIIGLGGVGAIYRRSLAHARRSYPWLPVMHGPGLIPAESTRLCEALAGRRAAEAASAAALLHLTFCTLLASLVGSPLANRLLALSSASGLGIDGPQERVE